MVHLLTIFVLLNILRDSVGLLAGFWPLVGLALCGIQLTECSWKQARGLALAAFMIGLGAAVPALHGLAALGMALSMASRCAPDGRAWLCAASAVLLVQAFGLQYWLGSYYPVPKAHCLGGALLPEYGLALWIAGRHSGASMWRVIGVVLIVSALGMVAVSLQHAEGATNISSAGAIAAAVGYWGFLRPVGKAPYCELRGVAVLLASVAVCSLTVWSFSCASAVSNTVRAPHVLAVSDTGADWREPTDTDYGMYAVGMYGLLDNYVEASNARWSWLELRRSQALQQSDLQGVDIMLLVHCQRRWSTAELACLEQYCARGGVIWVVGDHTDAFGASTATNGLLTQFGCCIRMDSAVPPDGEWNGRLVIAPGMHNRFSHSFVQQGLSWSIGASLEVDGNWYPLLVGRGALSDRGSYDNLMGNYLGDYKRQSDELVGDLVLMAARQWGRGGVVVCADSGLLQNGAIAAHWNDGLGAIFLGAPVWLKAWCLNPWGRWLGAVCVVLLAMRRVVSKSSWVGAIGIVLGSGVGATLGEGRAQIEDRWHSEVPLGAVVTQLV